MKGFFSDMVIDACTVAGTVVCAVACADDACTHQLCAIDYTADASENVTAILTAIAHLRVLNTLASTVRFIL